MKIKNKYLLLFFILLPGINLEAGTFLIDTLSINEVKVVSSRTRFYREDLKNTELDSAVLSNHSFNDLGELLIAGGTFNVLTYGGDGSISTISLRGSGSAHTQVLWNGFPLNSLTTGIADLSLIPVNFFNRVRITSGSSGSLYGGGTFGGAIDLNKTIDWGSRFNVSAGMEFGSFGSYKPGLELGVGNNKIHYDLNFNYNRVANDFPYTDLEKPGQPLEFSEHNKMESVGVIQKLQFLLPKNNTLQVGMWYFVKHKEIPLSEGSYGESRQSQTDSSLKVFLKWRKVFQKTSMEFKTAYLYDHLRFTDKSPDSEGNYSLDSRIASQQVYFDFNSRFFHFRNFTIDAGGNLSLLSADVSSYGGRVSEYRANLITGAQYRLKRLKLNASFRLNFNSYHRPPPLLSLGANYAVKNNRWWIKMNISNKYRLPGFNDRYWQPGGNPDLLPEEGWSTDLGTVVQLLNVPEENGKLKMEMNLFTGRINNWIQWSPGPGFWSPVNYKNVWNRGLELDAEYQKIFGKFRLQLRINYSLTLSTLILTNDSYLTGKSLKYTPVNMVNNSWRFDYLSFYTDLNFRFVGNRYTTEDNDPFFMLDPYYLMDLTLGYKMIKLLPGSYVQLKIKNITNVKYQVIRSYPMPGRAWYLGIIIKINKKSKL